MLENLQATTVRTGSLSDQSQFMMLYDPLGFGEPITRPGAAFAG